MKTKVIYNCEICNSNFHGDNYVSNELAKEACLECEAYGYADPSLIDIFVMYQSFKEMTFCVAKLETNKGHFLSSSQWACRDTVGDTLGEQFCAGGNDSYIRAWNNQEFYKRDAVTDFGNHFKRLARYLISLNKEPKYWDGEKIVIYTGDLNDANDANDEEVDVEDINDVTKWVKEGESDFVGVHNYEVGEPSKDSIVFKRKAVYFTDWLYPKERQKEEVRDILDTFELYGNTEFEHDIQITQAPPFDLTFGFLFFDYGGVMTSGSDGTVYSHCQQVVLDAKKNPNRDYIITTTFSNFVSYMNEAIEEFGDHNLNNIYFSVKDFLKKNNYMK